MRKIIVIIALIISIFFVANCIKSHVNEVDKNVEYTTYIVKSGDTLWNIASKIESDKDIREIIYYIEKDNNITNCGTLQVGQKLKIRINY